MPDPTTLHFNSGVLRICARARINLRGLTHREAAEQAGLPPSTLSNFLASITKNLTLTNAALLMVWVGEPNVTEYLTGGDPDE